MIGRLRLFVVPGLAVAVVAGLLFIPSAVAQTRAPAPSRVDRCASVLQRQTMEPILARYRDRLRTAREAVAKEERALQYLLIADNSTRAALDAQIVKTNDARNALSRVRLDLLWDLRAVIPAQDRTLAFRCAERLLLRNR